MICIYNPPGWPSARLLAKEMGGVVQFNPCSGGDDHTVINWGFKSTFATLNKNIVGDKLKELGRLSSAGVTVPPYICSSFERLRQVWDGSRYRYYMESGEECLPRHAKHSGGTELVRRLTGRRLRTNPPDFFVKRMDFVDEYRVHIINGKSVKIGRKVKMHEDAHPWVRSHRYGWRPSYTSDVRLAVEATPGIREESKKAIAALNLDFGAVDVGVTREGRATVLEVNTAPGLKPSIAQIYAEKLKEMLS